MGPTQDNFLSWWQLCMLIIGQNDKMHRALNSKRSTELSAMSMWILVSHDNQYFSNLVFSLCMSDSLGYTQDTARSLFHCSRCSHFLLTQPQPEGLSHHCLMQPSYSHHLRKSCSLSPLALYIIIKPTLHFFLHSGHLNWYMHHHSPSQAEPLLYGDI